MRLNSSFTFKGINESKAKNRGDSQVTHSASHTDDDIIVKILTLNIGPHTHIG